MDKNPPRPMPPFDEQSIPGELHMLKLLLPYTPAALQQTFGILVRVMELQYTLQYFQQTGALLHSQNSAGFSSPFTILEEIAPYLPQKEAGMLDTFRSMMHIMEMVQMMQSFSENSENGDGTSGPGQPGTPSFDMGSLANLFAFASQNSGNLNPADLLAGMLSPEQQEMFEMYQNMFSSPEETAPPDPPDDVSSHPPDRDFPEEEDAPSVYNMQGVNQDE